MKKNVVAVDDRTYEVLSFLSERTDLTMLEIVAKAVKGFNKNGLKVVRLDTPCHTAGDWYLVG